MSNESFESMLTGGHPNSLGKTIEVVGEVLAKPDKLEALFNCYFSDNENVRLRTSNALKRISVEQLEWLIPYIDRLLEEISKIDQASTKWTLAQLFESLEKHMTKKQKSNAINILKDNLATHSDWIVLNSTTETLSNWAKKIMS